MKKVILLVHTVFYTCILTSQIPSGSIKGPIKWVSKIYPGTERNYWLYIPAQYNQNKPTCTMIVQDGLSRARGWKLSEHLDTLIHEGKIPPVLGIYIDPGRVISKDTTNYPRYNRSFEYDALGDRYARFLLEEILPEIKKSYNISDDTNDRSIAGASSGAICAFNAAWERPNEFRRVFSTIGTYVGLRGADEFHTLVRKTEPKPLRIFLEDGYNDLNIYAGDWYIANQQMLSALTWAGYEVNHAWGEGGHNNDHSLKIIRDALLWLWKDYPTPVQTHTDKYKGLTILKNQNGWEEINTNMHIYHIDGTASGDLILLAQNNKDIINHTKSIILFSSKHTIQEFSTGNQNQLLVSMGHTIAEVKEGKSQSLVTAYGVNNLQYTKSGLYFTTGHAISYFDSQTKKVITSQLNFKPSAFCINTEHSFITILDSTAVLGYSGKINDDGKIDNVQPYIHYHIPYGHSTCAPINAITDTSNMLYTATNMGVQITDQLGRVNMIIPSPENKAISDMCWGGVELNQLYIAAGGKVFRRKLNTKGKLSFESPNRPPVPRM